MRALRNRARKDRVNNNLEQAKHLYIQAIDVAKELKSREDVEKLENIVNKIELDLFLQRLQKIRKELIQMKLSE